MMPGLTSPVFAMQAVFGRHSIVRGCENTQDVNAHQVFEWHKHYREGRLEIVPSSNASSRLLPVKVSDSQPMVGSTSGPVEGKLGEPGSSISIWAMHEWAVRLGSKNDAFKCLPTDSASVRQISTKLSRL
jgi:hypothetical protein